MSKRTTARPAMDQKVVEGFDALLKVIPVAVATGKIEPALEWMRRVIEWYDKPDVQNNLVRRRKAVREAKMRSM